ASCRSTCRSRSRFSSRRRAQLQPAQRGARGSALHGMARAMTNNMVVGVSEGFRRTLEIVGVGYRAAVKGKNVDLSLGFSHPVSYPLPEGVTAEVDKDGKLHLMSANKALLGSVAADIRRFRPPEPYKGKGVRYQGEQIIRKEGKARGKK
ncbi:MAG: 50S ribosomal protein L6, partial [Deltaproteobacteria bacterium]|nr:50S ribosomal protein L6 [Deltaproteobacteria bacterium]